MLGMDRERERGCFFKLFWGLGGWLVGGTASEVGDFGWNNEVCRGGDTGDLL